MATRTVLVAVDDSEASERVVRFVNGFFTGLDVEVIGINVGREPAIWMPTGLAAGAFFAWPYLGDLPMPSPAERDDSLREAARAVEDSGLVDDDVIAELGDPVAHICEAATDQRADVIVVGDNHKSAWRRLLEGSVSTGVQRDAPCPVLVVP